MFLFLLLCVCCVACHVLYSPRLLLLAKLPALVTALVTALDTALASSGRNDGPPVSSSALKLMFLILIITHRLIES